MEIMNIEEIVARLRQTESRSKRKLLDEAADAIEELAKTSIFKRIPCEVDPRKEYVELDGIRLVREEGQIVGWYRPGDGLSNQVVLNMTNEKRLIDADAFLEKMKRTSRYFDLVFDVEEMPTVDAVEVVRCRECKHWKTKGSKAGNLFSDMEYIGGCEFANYYRRESDFCSYGERMEGADNDH